jgi:pyridinium-3,5-bisthiocarboxylic acid mononucleotide nickel chelatase
MAELTRVAWFHCFSGIAGDMALGALIDAGADVDEVRAILRRLPVDDWTLEVEPVLRGGIAATNVHVRTHEGHVVHRTAAHIIGLVHEARLPERVTRRAVATFDALAVAEGRLHRRPPSQVHFHEVGGIDAIVDIVGVCAALEVLGIDEVHASPVATGRGMVRSAHGLIPNPAPAVVVLLQGVPTYGIDIQVELTTPTGAALLAANAVSYGALPAMRIESSGFGAGDKILDDRPNTTQVVIGVRESAIERGQPVVLLEANLDDATGETLAHALTALLAAGAHDAWITPIVMKKGRPAHTVHALCDVALGGQVEAVLVAETGTLGVRGTRLERWPVERRLDRVEVDGRDVRVKVSPGRVKVEHEDAARVARLLGRPLREVVSLAEESWRRRTNEPPSLHVVPDPVDDASAPHSHRHGPTQDHSHAHHGHHDHQGPLVHGPGEHRSPDDDTPA